jgi:MFS family permease
MTSTVLTRDNRAAAATTEHTAPDIPAPRRLPGHLTLYLLASLVVSFLAGSSAPTPLYALYQAKWGFSPATTTVVFAVYAVAVLLALLTLGKLSDHLGRRPVLLAALAVQAGTMVIFATAGGVPELMVARVIQGIATGAALGAIGAGMLDLNRRRGTLANAVAPGIGTGSGAIISALAIRYLPAPTHLIYLVLLGVFALQALGVAVMPETVTRKAGALGSLVPEIKLPRSVRRPILVAVPVLFAVWSLAGLYASLGPALVRDLTGTRSVVLGGLALFVLAGAAATAVLVLRNVPPRAMMLAGTLALIVGVGVTLVAIDVDSVAGFFAGTAIAGVGFGSGFQGGIRTVLPLTEAHERAGVLSLLYVVSYLGLGLPSVAAGFAVVHFGNLLAVTRWYGAAVVLLALVALVGLRRRKSSSRPVVVPR